METNLGTNLTSFAPFLLGVLRGVQPDSEAPLTTADIILDTHLDQTVAAQLLDPPDPGAGNTLLHQAGVDLDLGSAGIIPLASVQSTGAGIDFSPLAEAAERPGLRLHRRVHQRQRRECLPAPHLQRRLAGNHARTLLAVPDPARPAQRRRSLYRHLQLVDRRRPATEPLAALGIDDSSRADGTDISWSAIMPGTQRSIALPAVVQAQLLSGDTVAWTLTGSYAPGFDFNFWTYADLGGTGWISYAYGFNQFTVSP